MATTILRAQVKFQAANALPEDAVVNTFHFACDDATANVEAMADEVRLALIDFYDDVHTPGTVALRGHMSNLMAATGHRIDVYDLQDPEPRAAIESATFSFSGVGADTLPSEVALCLSYQAAAISGQDQSRRRGRIYFGPIGSSSSVLTTGRPTSGLINALVGAGDWLKDKVWTATDGDWVVFSPTGSTFAAPPASNLTVASFASVTNGWCDNAFDTQRRRGAASTARTLFS